jgi:hypothetical protein
VSRWSNSAHEHAFKWVGGHSTFVGCASLPSRSGKGPGGFFHWRASLGVISLHEECIEYDIVDNTVQFRYGGK